MDLKIENINRGDSQSDIVNKLNYNFSQITGNLGGASGKTGKIGSPGDNGLTGPTGPIGSRGTRGNVWLVSDSAPMNGIIEGDYWVDTTNDCEVKKYESVNGTLSWVSQNFLLSQAGVFEIDPSLVGLTSGLPNQAYVQNLFFPERNTLILTDAVTGDVKNPQLSKIVIGNTGSIGNPLLEFTKGDYQESSSFYTKSPKLTWGSTNPASSNAYGLNFLSVDGMDFETGSFSSRSGSFFLDAGEFNGSDKGGLTADFSGSIYLNASNDFTIRYGPTSGTNPVSLQVTSQNVTQWNDSVFTANLPMELIGSPVNTTPTLASNGPLTYVRTQQPSSSENLFRASYRGIPGYSGLAGQDKDIYIVDAKGNNKFGKKISGFYPNPVVRSTTSSMGTMTYTSFPFGPQSYFTIVAGNFINSGNATVDGNVNRYWIGEVFFPDIYTLGSPTSNTLAIHVANISSSAGGFAYLLSGTTEAIKFCVRSSDSIGFNSIYLDANSSNTPSNGALNVSDSSQRISLLTDVDPNVYATFFEFTLIRATSNNYKLYYQASGGNIDTFVSDDNAFLTGVVSTQ